MDTRLKQPGKLPFYLGGQVHDPLRLVVELALRAKGDHVRELALEEVDGWHA
jgi:hypothetical protein